MRGKRDFLWQSWIKFYISFYIWLLLPLWFLWGLVVGATFYAQSACFWWVPVIRLTACKLTHMFSISGRTNVTHVTGGGLGFSAPPTLCKKWLVYKYCLGELQTNLCSSAYFSLLPCLNLPEYVNATKIIFLLVSRSLVMCALFQLDRTTFHWHKSWNFNLAKPKWTSPLQYMMIKRLRQMSSLNCI